MSAAPGLDAVTAAAERFFPGGQSEPVDGRSWLRTVMTGDGRYSVRQLDPGIPAIRVDLIHEFLAQPDLRSCTPLVANDNVGTLAFDARVWVDGSDAGTGIVAPEWNTLHLPAELSLDQLGSAAAALGVFHRSGLNHSILARAPRFKVQEALTLARRSLDASERRLAGEIRKESRARRWLSAARPLLTNAERTFEQAGYLRDETEVIAHLDIWGSHIVFAADGSGSFLDCATIRAAPASADLAQLVARSGDWSDERVERVLQRYADEMPIPPMQRRLLPWLTALDAIPTCGDLLVRAIDETRPLTETDRRVVFAAADLQLELLATLTQAFVPPPPRQYRRGGARSRRSG